MDFVRHDSIVRKIWGKPDTILFIFAAASAEFALNKAVDWLFYTGRLPADPIGRLFSTVAYARQIVFSTVEKSHHVIDNMARIHREVETSRSMNIPDWAYRDVLYMLIDYSIRSYELLNSKLSHSQKSEVYDVFRRVGERMGLKELPDHFSAWLISREHHLRRDLANSEFTTRLFAQYRLHLGPIRYRVLLLAQGLVVHDHVRQLLHLQKNWFSGMLVNGYKVLVQAGLDQHVKRIILPPRYVDQVLALDSPGSEVGQG